MVLAVRDVDAVLAEFIQAFERQTFPKRQVELIAVDCAPGGVKSARLEAWQARSKARVTIVSMENAEPSAARNVGLAQASGAWVTFPDPSDLLHPRYLAAVDTFLRRRAGLSVVSAYPLVFQQSVRDVRNNHPRKWQFANRKRVVDLDVEIDFFPFAPATFLRRDVIERTGLQFDEQLEPFFGVAHFVARYLLSAPQPRIGLARRARYLERRRTGNDALVRAPYADERTYGNVVERGYLDLLKRGRAGRGRVRPWVQQLVIQELAERYFREAEAFSSQIAVPPRIAPRFHELLAEITRWLDPDQLHAHRASRLEPVWVEVLLHAYRDEPWVATSADLTDVDTAMRLQRIAYRYRGPEPSTEVRIDDRPLVPAFSKRRTVRYFGRDQLQESIAWLPVGNVRLSLNGLDVDVRTALPARSPGAGRQAGEPLQRRLLSAPRRVRDRGASLVARLLAGTLFRPAFGGAWVLIDRVHDAGDNAQRLFEYLRRERPDINAWFVIDAASPHWSQLQSEARGRLLAYGSFRWKMLMLNAAWLLSSHTDASTIIRPHALRGLISSPTWKYAFLQHGVVHRDLSAWFNRRHIDLLVVSTEGELRSIAGDDNAYVLTHKEVRNTGLPRFDRLLALGQQVPDDRRDLVIVAPTWRTWLTVPSLPGKQRRPVDDAFWDSEYLRRWLELLRSPEVAAAVEGQGWQLAFMPHPNFQAALPGIDLPAHVQALTFTRDDPQAAYARCALLITDYSSVAFDAAFLNCPVVYYQFDRDELEAGRHHGRSGYFEYERDGFGPVVDAHGAAVAAIVDSIDRGPRPAVQYQARIDQTFPMRDGRASARVVAAVEELSRPWAHG